MGYEKAEQLLATLQPRIDAPWVDAVVGLARSGIVPATILAQRLGKELFLLRCQRHHAQPEWMGDPPPAGARLLVVDDIVSSGATLQRTHAFLKAHGHPMRSLAIFVDRSRAAHVPDHAHDAPGFVRFAWDRRESTPDARKLREEADMFPPALESDCFGVDMDGVLLPDVRKADYRRDLPLALRMRHRLPPYPADRLPAIDWSKAHIITGRPAMDYHLTREWLDGHGFAGCPLYCRDPARHGHSVEGTVAHKIDAVTRIGVSTFLESELIQATLVARGCPTVDVIWWGRRHRLRLGGVAQVA